MKEKRAAYIKDIMSWFQEKGLNNSFDPSPAFIKNRLIDIIREEEISKNDETIVRKFLNINKLDDLSEAVKKQDSQNFKSIQYLLIGRTTTPIKIGVEDLSAFLIGFIPRPFSMYSKISSNVKDIEKALTLIDEETLEEDIIYKSSKTATHSPTKLLKSVLISFIVISFLVGIWIVNDLFFKKAPQPQPTTVVYNTYTGNLNYFYQQKSDGEILLYPHKGEVENEQLKPATKEVMLTYFKQQNVAVSQEDEKRWFKDPTDVQKLEEKTDKLPIKIAEEVQKKIADKNKTTTVNRYKLTSIIAINNENGLDTDISAFFRGNYKKPTENCSITGNISYYFKESSFSNNMVVCSLKLYYVVKLNASSSIFEENTVTTKATGFSNEDAKKNAIKKIQFN